MILFFIIPLINCKINKDQGIFKMDIAYGNFDCRSNLERTFTIPFSDSFENVPQVFFFGIYFLLFIKCPLPSGQVRAVHISWNYQFFQNGQPNKLNSFSQKSQCRDCYSIINKFCFLGPLVFLISITNFTETFVQVEISNPAEKLNNLKHLGYQIILGIKEAFLDLGLDTVSQNSTLNIVPQASSWFITPYYGFNYDHSFTIRLNTSFYSNNSYAIYTCIQIYKLGNLYYFVPFTYRKVWIFYSLDVTFYFIELKKLIITQKQELFSTLDPYINIFIIQNQDIFNTQGTYISIINKLHQEIDLKITVKCSPNSIVKSQFLKSPKTYKFSHQCLSIEQNLKYIAKHAAFQKFSINIEEFSLVVKQILYNQIKQEIELIKIDIETE